MKIVKIIFIVFWLFLGIKTLASYPNLGISGAETLGVFITLGLIVGLPVFFVGRSLMNDQTDFDEE